MSETTFTIMASIVFLPLVYAATCWENRWWNRWGKTEGWLLTSQTPDGWDQCPEASFWNPWKRKVKHEQT